MERAVLGRTGLEVSVAGLGCGGPSCLGLRTGSSPAASLALVRQALDRGVNLLDTAPGYGTEEIVGQAIAGRRDEIVVSSKAVPRSGGAPLRAAQLLERIEQSLRRMRTDRIDIFHLHGVRLDRYDHCRSELVPALEQAREHGKIRFLGITEDFAGEPGHDMLAQAARDDVWDVMMVGFNLLNPSARERVFPLIRQRRVGTLVMCALRRALSQPARLREVLDELVGRGEISAEALQSEAPLDFLLNQEKAPTLIDAAYRFCRHEPGVDVVLTGTGNPSHLDANLDSLARGPLSSTTLERLRNLFGRVDSVSGE
jgi:aryl-alcohol dehydrogenase-like predicted oxidoreductase